MSRDDLEAVVKIVRGEQLDERRRRELSNRHGEILGELYLQVRKAIERKSARSPIDSPEAFLMSVGRLEYSRIHWRERKQAEKHTPTHDNSALNLESGVAIDLLHHSSDRTHIDELIQREECQILRSFMDRLSEKERQLVLGLSHVSPKRSHRGFSRHTGLSVRTLQRRRKELRERAKAELNK